MVLWEGILIVRPIMRPEELQAVLKNYCRVIMDDGGVVRKVRNEGVMRLHRGMYAGAMTKRRLYVPRKHEWRIHEPVDEKMLFHGRYIVFLFDANFQTTLGLQKKMEAGDTTLECLIRQRTKHHPLSSFKDPHDFEIGSDLPSLSEENSQLLSSHPTWSSWNEFQSKRWSDYLTQTPNTQITDVTAA
eukprot:Rhum_TRINITY_DN23486_c0_g1::Rhum_TRINITY_DN23486_c0_g1_i1::g.178110::m.178110